MKQNISKQGMVAVQRYLRYHRTRMGCERHTVSHIPIIESRHQRELCLPIIESRHQKERAMFTNIEWNMFLRVQTREKAEKLHHRFKQTIDKDIIVLTCECYWKDKTLFHSHLLSPLGIEPIPQAIFEVLNLCSHISSHWHITTPQYFHADQWEFTGLSGEQIGYMKIVGITWISFTIRNFDPMPDTNLMSKQQESSRACE